MYDRYAMQNQRYVNLERKNVSDSKILALYFEGFAQRKAMYIDIKIKVSWRLDDVIFMSPKDVRQKNC